MERQEDPINEWLFGPAYRSFVMITDEMQMASLSERAAISLVNLPALLRFIQTQSRHVVLNTDMMLNKFIKLTDGDSNFARKEVDTGFSRMHIHSLISFWSYIEVCLDDTSTALIRRCNKNDIDHDSILLPHSNSIPATSQKAAGKTQKKFLDIVRKGLKYNYMMSYEYLFKSFGILLNNSNELLLTMQEIKSLRNCILHRGGKVDEYAISVSPGIKFKPGETIEMDSRAFTIYKNAIADYILNFFNTIFTCKYRVCK